MLLACSIEERVYGSSSYSGDKVIRSVYLRLRGPRTAVDILSDPTHPLYASVHRALQSVLHHDECLVPLEIRMELADLDKGWREELTEIARGRGVHNQAVSAEPARIWRGLRFRSASEVRIAEALDRGGVLFFPLCLGRVTGPEGRVNREPDFLVCHEGRWGILEVDGEPFHPPQRAAHDHERDRLFKKHGIRVVEHYDATRCYENPDEVVANFLSILERV